MARGWHKAGTGRRGAVLKPQGTSVAEEKTNLLPPKLFVNPNFRAGFLLILLPIFPSTVLWQQRKGWKPPPLSWSYQSRSKQRKDQNHVGSSHKVVRSAPDLTENPVSLPCFYGVNPPSALLNLLTPEPDPARPGARGTRGISSCGDGASRGRDQPTPLHRGWHQS